MKEEENNLFPVEDEFFEDSAVGIEELNLVSNWTYEQKSLVEKELSSSRFVSRKR